MKLPLPITLGIVGASCLMLPGPALAQGVCAGLSGSTGTHHLTLISGGKERDYRVDVPSDYDPTSPTALLFNFHGFTSNAAQQAVVTDMPAQGNAQGFIVVHPDGYKRSWNAGTCCGSALAEDVDDVGFVLDMIEAISNTWCINPRRIHATGFSNGGYFSHRLGCELPDVIASIAPDAGLIGVPCSPSRPVPVHHTHGTDDGLVPYESGVEDVAWWAEHNGCLETSSVYYDRQRTTCIRYSGCDEDADVEMCTVSGGQHWWYDYNTSSTTSKVLDFFIEHPMR